MVSKYYNYVLTETAVSDIDNAFSYISDTLGNPDAASDLADRFEECIDKICKRPETGKNVENDFLKRNDIWRFLVNNYIVYYLIDSEKYEIVVLRFVYSGRDQDKILNDLQK